MDHVTLEVRLERHVVDDPALLRERPASRLDQTLHEPG